MYEYKPLDRKRKEIRLLILEPGIADSMLCCTLQHASLDTLTPPHYETTSYVCGDQTIKAYINLHGSEVEVPATSEAVLRCMRFQDKARTLWIDAICIDQNDIEERGHQVGMMYEIYTQTSHNLIYLGSNDDNVPKVQESMGDILREMSVETQDYVEFEEMLFESWGTLKYSNAPFSFNIDQSGLVEFFQNSWFSRLWVVQEASLAFESTCYIGRYHTPLAPVLRVARWLLYKLYQMPKMTPAQETGIRNAAYIFKAVDEKYGCCYRRENDLWKFLDWFGEFHTCDRRDQVFALVGLWKMHTRTTVLPATLKPDYTLSVSEVFANAVKLAIQERGDLDFLQAVSANPFGKEIGHWTSWVPVLDRKLGTGVYPLTLGCQFEADDRCPMRLFDHTFESNTLDIAGLFIDEVIGVTSTATLSPTSAVKSLMVSAESSRPKSSWAENPGIDTETRAAHVLQAGVTGFSKRSTDQEALHGYQSFKNYLEEHDYFPPYTSALAPTASDNERAAAHYALAFYTAATHRRVFHTKDGHLGLGPACTRPGDVVAILYGCQWPVVLRPLLVRGWYSFLEVSYVYGIMDGEAIRRHKKLGLEDDRFRII